MKRTGKLVLLAITGALFSVPAGAVVTEVLHCPGRSVMSVTLTGEYLITLRWKMQFFVGQLQRHVRLKGSDNVQLYRFQNGDLLFVDEIRQRQFFAPGGMPPLEACHTDGWITLHALELPYRHDS